MKRTTSTSSQPSCSCSEAAEQADRTTTYGSGNLDSSDEGAALRRAFKAVPGVFVLSFDFKAHTVGSTHTLDSIASETWRRPRGDASPWLAIFAGVLAGPHLLNPTRSTDTVHGN